VSGLASLNTSAAGKNVGQSGREEGSVMAEQHTEQTIRVRQVTDAQVSWSEHDRGEPGAFTIQLILDNGAEEYILRPTAEDARVQVELFKQANIVYFDLDRKVLIFGNLHFN
jgi:hypothetical protein